LDRWANKQKFIPPQKEFVSNQRKIFVAYFGRIFPNLDFVPEEEIHKGIAKILAANELPVISLDRVYFQSRFNLDITRTVNELKNSQGISNRAGSPTLEQQLRRIKKEDFQKVALADDVIFFGEGIKTILPLLAKIGIKVEKIYAGIGISEGIERLSNSGIEVLCVRRYKEVIDEICERDFYPGIPFSGRLLENSRNIGMPYILPFGNPVEWASIPPKHAQGLSKFCLNQTIDLFEHIEGLSHRKIITKDLDRKVEGIADNERFVEGLKKIADQF
jgi:hypothetical protein